MWTGTTTEPAVRDRTTGRGPPLAPRSLRAAESGRGGGALVERYFKLLTMVEKWDLTRSSVGSSSGVQWTAMRS